MKKVITIAIFTLSIAGCTALVDSPGTLGAEAIYGLDCPEDHVARELDQIAAVEQFKPALADTAIVEWWKTGGYDFLNYRCLSIQKTLYMITVNSEGVNSADISIRSFYSRRKKEWIFAKDFSDREIDRAEKAMEYMSEYIADCN